MFLKPSMDRALPIKKELASNPGAVFGSILTAEEIKEQCHALGYRWRERIFTPLVTLWTFLGQALNADSSCKKAVAKALGFLAATTGLKASYDPGAYCRARKRLPLALLMCLVRLVAGKLAAKAGSDDLWHGHKVKLVDGSSVAMADTKKNQAAYPQPKAQKPGCGFPVARLVALFDLIAGAVVHLAMSPLSVAETVLFPQLWDALEPHDIVVGDRNFCSYPNIALLQRRGVFSLFRLNPHREDDIRRGRHLGYCDRLVRWVKGAKPKWLSPEEFDAVPGELIVRLFKFHCQVPGWRVKVVLAATTLLDPRAYPRRDLANLFLRRWNVETDLRHLKTTMQMEFLRTKSPAMVQREVWAHLLAYDLIRTLMWESAKKGRHLDPLTLSLKGTIQAMTSLWPFTAAATCHRDLTASFDDLLRAIRYQKISPRPHRVEPRVRKRRPKNYKLMLKPRQEYRKELRAS